MGECRLSELIPPAFRALHAQIREGRYSEYWLRGGRGSGKSSFVSLQVVLELLRHPDRSAVVYRRVGSTLRESVYEQVLWAFRALGIDGLCEARLMPLEIRIPATGQRILFRGADDPGKSKSLKLNSGYFGVLWFEEAAEFSGMEDIRTIRASVLRGGPGVTFFSYNPPVSDRSWINAEALLQVPGRRVHRSDYRDVPPEWLGETFLTEAEHLRSRSERLWRHMYLGEAVGTGAQVFGNLQIRAADRTELRGADRELAGLDFGFAADPDALIRARFDPKRRRLYLTDEFYAVRTPVDVLTRTVRDRCGREAVRCDSAEPRLIRELRARGVNAVAAKKGPGSVHAGIRYLQELDCIVIDPAACPNAVREFTGYEYESDGQGGFVSDCPDRDNHLIDALRYAMEPYSARRRAETLKKSALGV